MAEREPVEPLPVKVFDSHCHLDVAFGDAAVTPVPAALAAARAVGVARIVQIGCDLPSSRWAAATAARHDDVYGGVAIHPNETAGLADDVLASIEALAGQPKVRAVGETGLDYYRDTAGAEEQRRAFREHIGIAKRTGKALVIHDREAHDDVLRILREEGAPDQVVFHCFSGDVAMAAECARLGYVMSFAGNVTFKNAQPLRDALAVAPPELVLVETDAPFLTPVPYRGRPNNSALIPLTVRCMAEVKKLDVDALCASIAANGVRVFGPW